jgi:hypothetical protein
MRNRRPPILIILFRYYFSALGFRYSVVKVLNPTFNVVVFGLCKDYEHYLSPHWYDIIHFGSKLSWICSWAIPKKHHANEDICPSLYTHDPPHF